MQHYHRPAPGSLRFCSDDRQRETAREALFPRSFTARVTLIAPRAGHDLTGNDQAMPEDTGIAHRDDPIIGYAIKQHRLLIATASARLAFEAVYPA